MRLDLQKCTCQHPANNFCVCVVFFCLFVFKRVVVLWINFNCMSCTSNDSTGTYMYIVYHLHSINGSHANNGRRLLLHIKGTSIGSSAECIHMYTVRLFLMPAYKSALLSTVLFGAVECRYYSQPSLLRNFRHILCTTCT